ncbi:B3 domain-containing transcription factor VRN1-like [Quercus robur]|uniref:B3 domain-containing transcription factor VRN1-like n=1 Tax=Quercus robur TaxID=38942 RepID=UPI002161F427|nr:B3 domain-containing transcription factor VRN1-like [Quercus robur]
MTYQNRRCHADAPCDLTEGTHFFQIILHKNLRNGRLTIPKKFTSKYGEKLSSLAILTLPNGAKWEVGLTKHEGEVWLQKGWREFAEYYSLKLGYLVVFRYEENSHFHVLIFDPSATEVDYPSKSSNGHEEGQCDEEDTDESDTSIQILPNSCPLRPKRRDTSLLPRGKKMKTTSTSGRIRSQKSELHARSGQLTKIEKAKALKKASGFKSKNPHFMVVMQQSFVTAWYLSIPVRFTQEKYIQSGHYVTLKVGDKSWEVLFSIAVGKRSGSFSSGWSTFAEANRLQLEDVCVFELIKRNNGVVLEVSIFRDGLS